MKSGVSLACAVLLVATAGSSASAASAAAPAKAAHKAPVAQDWTRAVKATPAGGFVMGNPDAKVKLVEYGSMTCPHCKRFDDTAVPQLIDRYVKSGQVSWEFRNYVRDALDVTASLVARCNGAKSFFPLTRALYDDQENWFTKVQAAPQDQMTQIQNLPANQQFVQLAKLAGFQDWAAARGLPPAKSNQCLSNQQSVDQLVQITSDATNQFPGFQGTPTFVIGGKMVELGPVTEEQVWPKLEAQIKAALGERG